MHIADRGTLDIFHGKNTAAARRSLARQLHHRAAELLDRLNAAASPNDLRSPAGNRLEKLRGERKGQWSIRINDAYRICFIWDQGEARNVEVVDYH
jgi:proteic killer suppression protein